MKTLFSILGFIAAILAIVLAILPLEKIALIPAILALIFVLISYVLAKNEGKKFISLTFILTVISFALITYKYIFASEPEVTLDQEFIEKNKQSEEKAIEELEDLEDLDTFEETDSIN